MSTQETAKFDQRRALFTSPGYFTSLLQRNSRSWMAIFLLLVDLTGLSTTIALSLILQRFILHRSPNPEMLHEMLILPLVFVIISSACGLYPAFGINSVEELRRQTLATSLVFLSLIGLTFLTKSSLIYSRFLFLSCWTMSLVILPLFRTVLRTFLPRFKNWGEPVVIIGAFETAVEIADYLQMNRSIGLRPAAIFVDLPGKTDKIGIPSLPIKKLVGFCSRKKIESAIVIESMTDRLFDSLDIYDDLFKRVVFVPHSHHRDSLSGLTVMEYGELVGFEKKHNLLDRRSQLIKRAIDLLVSSTGLVLLMPVFLVIAMIIWLDSPGRIFYRQTRIGKNNRKFSMVKFRTMQINADRVLHQYLDQNPSQMKEWEQYQKLKYDPRITRFGRILRRFSIDEFPQLWNVVKGEMSLVGPRPILSGQYERYGKPYSLYKKVNPGITGLWQISGRAATSFNRRVELDKEYVMNWSVWLDILILVKTLRVVVKQNGAF